MTKSWYILIVKPRHEIKVSKALSDLEIETYCPVTKEVRFWSDRKKTIEVPIFKPYVFVRLTDKERPTVFDVPGASRYLFWLGKPAIIRDEEMDTLKKWLSSDTVEECQITQLAPGKSLSLTMGTLKDQPAVVQQIGKSRIRLEIKGLGILLNMKIKDLL